MPVTFNVCQTKTGSASFSKESNKALEKIKKTHTIEFLVEAVGASDPSGVDEIMVGNAPGIPSLATSVYQDPETGNIFPYFSAKSKEVTRLDGNGFWFKVVVKYDDETGEEQNQTPPNDPEDIPSTSTWSTGERTETAWDTTDGEPCLLPTRTLYSVPTVRRVPVLIGTFTQFENTFDDSDLYDRLYKCNSQPWTPDAITWAPHEALITDIKYESAVVPIAGGITMNSNKVTYTIECVSYSIKDLDDDEQIYVIKVGHEAVRIRADTRYLDGGDPKKVKLALAGNHMGLTSVYLKKNGEPFPAANQGGIPPHDILKLQSEKSFSFLRT